jgi:hypothetical protein
MAISALDIKEAKSRMYADPYLDTITNAEHILIYCLNAFRQADYAITTKKKAILFKKFSRVATTLPGQLMLPYDFESKLLETKAGLLAHERIHLVQQQVVGGAKFRRQYVINPKQRLIWELQAYCESIRVAKRLGRNVSGYAESTTEMIIEDYTPWLTLSKSEIRRASLDVLGNAVAS